MTLNARRLNKYHPRRSSKEMKIHKQKLSDLEHKIAADVGELLVLLKEGSPEKVQEISEQTKTDLLKFGPQMKEIALDIGAPFPKIVKDFLCTVDLLIHFKEKDSKAPFYLWVDDAKIQSCFLVTDKLERALLK